jgi:hypothetical protein
MIKTDNINRFLMKEYIAMNDSNPNKKELKKELMLKLPQPANPEMLDAWIQNELKNELEEQMLAVVSASFGNYGKN